MRITIVDRETERIKQQLHMRYPLLDRFCEIVTHDIDINSPLFQQVGFLESSHIGGPHNGNAGHDITAIYVCLPDDTLSLCAGLALLHQVKGRRIPIVVRMTQESGLTALMHGVASSSADFQSLHPVGLMERTCRPDLVLGGTREMLARAFHGKYVSDQERAGQTVETNPLLRTWDELPEEARESNRRQADGMAERLQAIGCDIFPLTEWEAGSFTFTADEVELMARLEHERWLQERLEAGWRYGPERDLARKTNPSLVPWEQLPAETRELNCGAVRRVPDELARAGFQIYRTRNS
jgi:hypothetical protein